MRQGNSICCCDMLASCCSSFGSCLTGEQPSLQPPDPVREKTGLESLVALKDPVHKSRLPDNSPPKSKGGGRLGFASWLDPPTSYLKKRGQKFIRTVSKDDCLWGCCTVAIQERPECKPEGQVRIQTQRISSHVCSDHFARTFL